MKKVIIYIVLIVVIGASGYFAVHSMRSQLPTQSTTAVSKSLPSAFGSLAPGMSENDVKSDLGNPVKVTSNPRYQVKTPQEWAAIEAADNVDTGVNSGAPTLAQLKAGAELEHRIKDVWQYNAGGSPVILSFDGQGELIKWAAMAGSGKH